MKRSAPAGDIVAGDKLDSPFQNLLIASAIIGNYEPGGDDLGETLPFKLCWVHCLTQAARLDVCRPVHEREDPRELPLAVEAIWLDVYGDSPDIPFLKLFAT